MKKYESNFIREIKFLSSNFCRFVQEGLVKNSQQTNTGRVFDRALWTRPLTPNLDF